MTEETRLEGHRNAHSPEEHKKIEAQKTLEKIEASITDIKKYAAEKKFGIVEYLVPLAIGDIEEALKDGHITTEQMVAYKEELRPLFKEAEGLTDEQVGEGPEELAA